MGTVALFQSTFIFYRTDLGCTLFDMCSWSSTRDRKVRQQTVSGLASPDQVPCSLGPPGTGRTPCTGSSLVSDLLWRRLNRRGEELSQGHYHPNTHCQRHRRSLICWDTSQTRCKIGFVRSRRWTDFLSTEFSWRIRTESFCCSWISAKTTRFTSHFTEIFQLTGVPKNIASENWTERKKIRKRARIMMNRWEVDGWLSKIRQTEYRHEHTCGAYNGYSSRADHLQKPVFESQYYQGLWVFPSTFIGFPNTDGTW